LPEVSRCPRSGWLVLVAMLHAARQRKNPVIWCREYIRQGRYRRAERPELRAERQELRADLLACLADGFQDGVDVLLVGERAHDVRLQRDDWFAVVGLAVTVG
jgi:hypothetical protein